MNGFLAKKGGDGGAGERMEMHIKADHRTAGVGIDLYSRNIQRIDGKNIAVGFTFWRRRAAITGFAKVGSCLDSAIRQRAYP